MVINSIAENIQYFHEYRLPINSPRCRLHIAVKTSFDYSCRNMETHKICLTGFIGPPHITSRRMV